jgi:moderate conductance mechanosensitive channel
VKVHGWAFGLAAAVSAIGAFGAATIAFAQPMPVVIPSPPPATVDLYHKYRIKRVGTLEVAPVTFENIRLFDVSAPLDRDPAAFPPVAARVDVIESNLEHVVPPLSSISHFFAPAPSRFDPDSFEVRIGKQNGYVTLYASDHKGSPQVSLLTLTEQDARYQGVSEHELARSWADTLQSVLGDALRARQPGALSRQLASAGLTIVAALAWTLLVFILRRFLRHRQTLIERRLELADLEPDGEAQRRRLGPWSTALLILHWLLGWSVSAVWTLAALVVLFCFPATQSISRKLSGQLLSIFFIWFAAAIVDRFGHFLVNRFARQWEQRPFLSADEVGRRHLRLPTITRAADYAKSLAIYLIAFALTLGAVGASASAVVTLGAAIAFAISFGAQSLVKDLVNGLFILLEDQYAIGDYVTIGAVAGLVEGVTLRITQLRSDDGRLVTIPNSQVAVVENWTRTWSRVDYRVVVAHDADVARASAALEGVLDELAHDPQWGASVTEPPRMLGVDSIGSTGIVLRAWVKTAPGKMFVLSREINRRVAEAFAKDGIAMGMPTSRVYRDAPSTPPDEASEAEPS